MTPRTVLVTASLLLSVAIGWTLSRRNSASESAERKPRIGLSLGTLKEERWQRDRDQFVARAEELGAEVFVQSGNNEAARQIQDIESLLSRGVDVLVIVARDPNAMEKSIAAANAARVPVICYDRMISNCDVDLFLSFDNLRVGQLQAEYLVQKLNGRGKIIRVYGSRADQTGLQFKEGQDMVLRPLIESGAIQVLHEDYAEDWKPDQAKKIVNAAITAHGRDFDAVLSTNDGMAGGAIQALLEEGLAGEVLVTGQDADLAACQRILRGTQSMSIYKPLKSLAVRAADVAVAIANRKVIVATGSVPNGFKDVPSILEQVVVVDRGNVVDTVVKDGFHTAESLQ